MATLWAGVGRSWGTELLSTDRRVRRDGRRGGVVLMAQSYRMSKTSTITSSEGRWISLQRADSILKRYSDAMD